MRRILSVCINRHAVRDACRSARYRRVVNPDLELRSTPSLCGLRSATEDRVRRFISKWKPIRQRAINEVLAAVLFI